MIVKMAKIRILGPKTLLPFVIEVLQETGVIHIESRPPEVAEVSLLPGIPEIRRLTLEEATLEARKTLETLLDRVKKILLMLPPPFELRDVGPDNLPLELTEASMKKLASQLGAIAPRVETLVRKRTVSEDELSLLARYEKILSALSPLIATVRESEELEYLGLVIQAKQRHIVPVLEEVLARRTGGRFEIFYREVDKETLAGLLVFPKEARDQVKALLWEESIGELRLPTAIQDRPLGEALKIVLRKQAELPGKIRKLDRELAEISRRWGGWLNQVRIWLKNRIEQILVSASFYETRMTFLIYGWIPQKDGPALQERLSTVFSRRVVVDRLSVEKREEDHIPVLLRNPLWIRPFEVFTRFLAVPRYGTIDPTPFIALFFPLIFGIIIGDIGYGLVLLIGAVLVQKKYQSNPFIRDMAAILSWCAVFSLLWGIAYGELFGDLGERLGLHPILFNRMENIPHTLFLAVAIGVVHILLGIGLGIFTAVRRGRRREIIARSTGLVVVVAFLLMVCGILGWLPRGAIPVSLAIILISLPVLILGGGPSAVMELHNIVNILSYLRIMGVGMASVALAFAVNKLSSMAGNLVLVIILGVVLHALHLAIDIFSPTIQTLRLHYVEFFENFFHGGGSEYRPFRKLA